MAVRDVRAAMQRTPQPATADPAHTAHVPRVGRIGLIDVARGVAILAVIAYHLTWDLGDLGLLNGRPAQTPLGHHIAQGIAGTFLFLVGVSLVLAHGDGFRATAFVRRLAEVFGYGLLISLATWIVMPSQWVSFGILQCIVVVSVLALPFLRGSRAIALGAAGLAVALPGLVEIPGSSRWWSWTGLTASTQPTIDNAPVLPMFALTLLGIVLMRTLRAGDGHRRLAQVRTDRGVLRWLSFLGRHTLVVYLLHQPILLGLLHAYLWVR